MVRYALVIDSGSLGSRAQVYRWDNEGSSSSSLPKIEHEDGWSKKTSPGLSSYADNIKGIWDDHYAPLFHFAEKIIPADHIPETPVFIQCTAGMRLLSLEKQHAMLNQVCRAIRKHTRYSLPSCQEFVQVIDGETEGVYGWLGLNYLMGLFETGNGGDTLGFMDMGGALQQIAFVPSNPQDVEKHQEDLSKVALRLQDGTQREWSLFVQTWLGFGANKARERYFQQLIHTKEDNHNKGMDISDACMPKGAISTYKGHTFKGTGNYGSCIKTIYPLLMKDEPCIDEPCLFNGVHGPSINFDKDKFIGISEYWYTANDIFESGGEYNFHLFNEKVKLYCESQWDTVLENSKNGHYSGLDPEKYLKDACFKASWVINILHEGFEVPRLGVDVKDSTVDEEGKKLDKIHIPFKSANSVNGEELSWTLGKVLLYASSEIKLKEEKEHSQVKQVGIYPPPISQKPFIPGGIPAKLDPMGGYYLGGTSSTTASSSFIFIIVVLILVVGFLYKFTENLRLRKLKGVLRHSILKVPFVSRLVDSYIFLPRDDAIILEEGLFDPGNTATTTRTNPSGKVLPYDDNSVLRTRSAVNLQQDFMPTTTTTPDVRSFANKPFIPFKNKNFSFDALPRSNSSGSIKIFKKPDH